MEVYELDLKADVDLTPLEREVRSIADLLQMKVKGERVRLDITRMTLHEETQQATFIVQTDASYSTLTKRFSRAGANIMRAGVVTDNPGCWEIVFRPAGISL